MILEWKCGFILHWTMLVFLAIVYPIVTQGARRVVTARHYAEISLRHDTIDNNTIIVLLAKHRHYYPSFTRICNNWTFYIWYSSTIALLADVVDEAWRASDLHGSVGRELEHPNKLLWGKLTQLSDLSNYQASQLKLGLKQLRNQFRWIIREKVTWTTYHI